MTRAEQRKIIEEICNRCAGHPHHRHYPLRLPMRTDREAAAYSLFHRVVTACDMLHANTPREDVLAYLREGATKNAMLLGETAMRRILEHLERKPQPELPSDVAMCCQNLSHKGSGTLTCEECRAQFK